MVVKHLVIVESSTKAKTISKYLNNQSSNIEFIVKACNGHICDLVNEKTSFGINMDTYFPSYELLSDKQRIVKDLRSHVKECNKVWLATDNDREGEAIAWHLKTFLKLKEGNFKRILFNEITKNAIISAINNPQDIDMHLVQAQQARRVLDRVVGFGLTKELYRNFNSKDVLSAGRVQSVVLLILNNLEKLIQEHKPTEYWNVIGTFDEGIVDAKLYEKDSICKFSSESSVTGFLQNLTNTFYINPSKTLIDNTKVYPEQPFTTSTLQQTAYNQLGYSIQKTMKIAQELYENGHITYMRTDSTNLSSAIVQSIHKYISEKYNVDFIDTQKKSKKQQKNAQEAHEAIRPTHLKYPSQLQNEQLKLYSLIFKRTVASQMKPAIIDELTIEITNHTMKSNEMYFKGIFKKISYPGFKVVYDISADSTNLDQQMKKFKRPDFTVSSKKIIGNHIWTVPHQRFNESTLIKDLEKKGIGRPSTYVSIISKLYDRKFVIKNDVVGPDTVFKDFILQNGKITIDKTVKKLFKENNKLITTDKGKQVIEYLRIKFSEIIDIDFTNKMESDLDRIALNEKQYMHLVQPFVEFLKNKCANERKSTKTQLSSPEKEFKINNQMYVVREAKFGPVIEHKESKTFYGLTPYLDISKKQLKDTDIHDVNLIISTPIHYKHFTIKYARYGFYVTNNETNKSENINNQKYLTNLFSKDFSFVETIFDSSGKKTFKKYYKKTKTETKN
jgi:DNA topoisomerase-1